MARNLFSEIGNVITERVNMMNPGASVSRTSTNPMLDWARGTRRAYEDRAMLRLARERELAEERKRQEAERERLEKQKEKNLLKTGLKKAKDAGGSTARGIKKSSGIAAESIGDTARPAARGLKRAASKAWDVSGDISTMALATPARFGDLKIEYDENGNPVATRDYSWESVAKGPINFFNTGRQRAERAEMRTAGIDPGDDWRGWMRAEGESFRNDPDVPAGVKVGLGLALDPQTWVPAGTLAKGAKGLGLTDDLVRNSRALRAARPAAKVAEAVVEGASPKVMAGVIGGAAAAAQGSEMLGLSGTPAMLATMAGSTLGGAATGGFKRAPTQMDVASPKGAPRNRPIVPKTDRESIELKEWPGIPDGQLVYRGGEVVAAVRQGSDGSFTVQEVKNGMAGRVERYTSDETPLELVLSMYQRKKAPEPMASERMWFHSTGGDHDALDPEFGLGQAVGITQGPGIYLAADPGHSARTYGNRTFATEFDGKVLDLTAPGDVAYWKTVADRLGVEMPSEAQLADAKRFAYSPLAKRAEGFTNYHYRDAIVGEVWGSLRRGQTDKLGALGTSRFRKALPEDGNDSWASFGTGVAPEDDKAALILVQDAIGDTYDAVFHHSEFDGEVLVVINGDKLRTVGELENARSLPEAGSWDEVKSAVKSGTHSPVGKWVYEGGIRVLEDASGNELGFVEPLRGKFHAVAGAYGDMDFDTFEEAKVWVEGLLANKRRPSFREYADSGMVGEAGQVDPRFAGMLASTALGAGVGYAAGEEEGAAIGAGLGLGVGAVPFMRGRLPMAGDSRAGYEAGLPGPELQKLIPSTPIDRFAVGTQVVSRNHRKMGTVVAVDASGVLTVKNGNNTYRVKADSVYSKADADAVLSQRKIREAQQKVLPAQGLIDRTRADFEDALRHSEAMLESGHVAGRKTGLIGKAIDPASKFVTPVQKRVHSAITAGANLIHRGDSVANARADQLLKILDPLMAEGRFAGIKRAGAQGLTLSAPTVAGIALEELTGQQGLAELGAVAGIGAMGLTSHKQHQGFMGETPWAKLTPRDPELLTGKIADPKSQDRLIDILQYWDGPEGYDLSLLHPTERAVLEEMKKAWDQADMANLVQVNAALATAGIQPLPMLESHGVLQAYTEKSMKETGAKLDKVSPIDIRSTSFRREQSIEQERLFGKTLREAYERYPGLELKGSFRDLLIQQLREQERIKAGALVTGDLINSEIAERIPSDMELRGMDPVKRAEAQERINGLAKAGWMHMPGVDDVLFPPEVIQTVKDLLVSTRGSENGVMNWLDEATNIARTALFVGDLNAWTMQGAMTAMQNPMAAIRNFFPLVGATAFGEAYANRFKMAHPEMVDAAAKGGARSFEHGGLERELAGFHKLPGFRQIEDRAVAFLDVFRLVMHDNIAKQEAFLSATGAAPKRGLKGKAATNLGHIGLEAVRLGPALAGGAAAVTGNEIDLPGVPDWGDKLFTLALGVTAGVGADVAVTRAGADAMQGARSAPQAGGFKTALGSTYEVHPDGTTTRNKAPRAAHPGQFGPQPTSAATYYVTQQDAGALARIQAVSGPRMEIAEVPSMPGHIGVRYLDGKDAGKFERNTVVPFTTSPEVGRMPLEVWDGSAGRTRTHFGNPITEVLASGVGGRRSDAEVAANALAGKMTNRISGTLNRQALGISNQQAQIERVGLMRSPALTRNALAMAKLAVTDAGAEGAIARIYLVKTAILTGAMMAFLHAVSEGRMPDASDFDPSNPESPFSPESFGRADMGRLGRLTPSNPLMALMRAFMHNEHPSGESEWHWPDASEVGLGLTRWASGRTPDIVGKFLEPRLEQLATGIPPEEVSQNAGLVNRLQDGDLFGIGRDLASVGLPVSVQSAINTGVLGDTDLGRAVGLEGDPNYNYAGERLLGAGATLLGTNHSPESLGKELPVRKDEEAEAMFGGAYETLNKEEQAKVREKLEADQTYVRAEEGRKAQGGEDTPSPIQRYFDAQTVVTDDIQKKIALADAEYQRTGNGQAFRKRLQELANERRIRLGQVKQDLATQSAELRGRDETVEEWLGRNIQPEDQAVQQYYELFEKATDPASGQLDFDGLEIMQDKFLSGLDPMTRDYVSRRINQEKELTAGQQEYERVKQITKPYFELREKHFNELRATDPFLSQFSTYSELQKFADQVAYDYGITQDDAMDVLSRQSIGLIMLERLASMEGKLLRFGNPEMDAALTDWYGYSPVSIPGRVGRAVGQATATLEQPMPQRKTRGLRRRRYYS